MVARLTLTQEAVVRIHDPEPYMVSKTGHCGSNPQARAI